MRTAPHREPVAPRRRYVIPKTRIGWLSVGSILGYAVICLALWIAMREFARGNNVSILPPRHYFYVAHAGALCLMMGASMSAVAILFRRERSIVVVLTFVSAMMLLLAGCRELYPTILNHSGTDA